MIRGFLYGLIGLAMGAFMSAPVGAQSADGSELTQQILPLDCTITQTSNGSGTVVNSNCPPQAPIIDSITGADGYPIITGRYDAANSHTFRVFAGGRWYVLGVDPELTASGNMWRLDLSGLANPLPPGSYTIIAEMIANDGTRLSDDTTHTVDTPTDPVDPANPDTPTGPTAPETGFQKILQTFGVATLIPALLAAVLVGGVFVWRYRRRSDDK